MRLASGLVEAVGDPDDVGVAGAGVVDAGHQGGVAGDGNRLSELLARSGWRQDDCEVPGVLAAVVDIGDPGKLVAGDDRVVVDGNCRRESR